MFLIKTNYKKITQAALKILEKYGGELNYTKLIKLLYLSDREALKLWLLPISTDSYYALENGPILSCLYDLILGKQCGEVQDYWDSYVDKKNFNIKSKNKEIPKNERELSKREIELLNKIADKFYDYNYWQLIEYCHDPANIPEWEDPGRSANPLPIEDILRALGYDEKLIQEAKEDYNIYYKEAEILHQI